MKLIIIWSHCPHTLIHKNNVQCRFRLQTIQYLHKNKTKQNLKEQVWLDVVVHTCNPSAQEERLRSTWAIETIQKKKKNRSGYTGYNSVVKYTSGMLEDRQGLYHLSHPPSPWQLFFGGFEFKALHLFGRHSTAQASPLPFLLILWR
jgi:hypothetical protein